MPYYVVNYLNFDLNQELMFITIVLHEFMITTHELIAVLISLLMLSITGQYRLMRLSAREVVLCIVVLGFTFSPSLNTPDSVICICRAMLVSALTCAVINLRGAYGNSSVG